MADKTNIQKLLDIISVKLETDILVECFAAMVANSGTYAENEIHILPAHNFRRNYRNDIVGIKQLTIEDEKNDYEEERILNIQTSRTGVLDYLPEAFFEQKPFKLRDETIEQWQKRIEEYWKKLPEKNESAQRFFRPLEIEYNKIRIRRERREVNLLRDKNPLLKRIWKEFATDTLAQRRFVSTLHLLTYVVGDKHKTKHLIEYVLGKKITLQFGVREKTELPADLKPTIGSAGLALGFNSNIGSDIYEYAQTCTFTIMDLQKREFFDYQDPQSVPRKLLDTIEKYYFPLDVEVSFSFQISTAPQRKTRTDGTTYEAPIDQFYLNDNPKSGEGCIGFSTRLGEAIEV